MVAQALGVHMVQDAPDLVRAGNPQFSKIGFKADTVHAPVPASGKFTGIGTAEHGLEFVQGFHHRRLTCLFCFIPVQHEKTAQKKGGGMAVGNPVEGG